MSLHRSEVRTSGCQPEERSSILREGVAQGYGEGWQSGYCSSLLNCQGDLSCGSSNLPPSVGRRVLFSHAGASHNGQCGLLIRGSSRLRLRARLFSQRQRQENKNDKEAGMKRKTRRNVTGLVAQVAAQAAFTRAVQSSSLCEPISRADYSAILIWTTLLLIADGAMAT